MFRVTPYFLFDKILLFKKKIKNLNPNQIIILNISTPAISLNYGVLSVIITYTYSQEQSRSFYQAVMCLSYPWASHKHILNIIFWVRKSFLAYPETRFLRDGKTSFYYLTGCYFGDNFTILEDNYIIFYNVNVLWCLFQCNQFLQGNFMPYNSTKLTWVNGLVSSLVTWETIIWSSAQGMPLTIPNNLQELE